MHSRQAHPRHGYSRDARGRSVARGILRDFPYLEADDIKAALAYAARQSDHAVLQSA